MVKKETDIKEKVKEFKKRLVKLQDEHFKIRLEHSQGKLKNTSLLTAKRKEIAKLLTEERKLEINI